MSDTAPLPEEPQVEGFSIPDPRRLHWDLGNNQESPDRAVRVYACFECPTIRKVLTRGQAPGTAFGVTTTEKYETFGQTFNSFEEAYGHSMKHEVWGYVCLLERFTSSVVNRPMLRVRVPDFSGLVITANWKDDQTVMQQEIQRCMSEMIDKLAREVNACRDAGKPLPTPTPFAEAPILANSVEVQRGYIFTSIPKKVN